MPKYDPVGGRCSGGPQAGTRALMAAILEYFPGSTNVGIYNCRNVGGTSRLSVHAEGRAGDNGFVGADPSPIGFKLADWLVANADHLGIQTVIWNRRIWGGGKGWSWRRYGGQSPHIDHVHWENTWDAARNLTRAHIDKVKPGAQPPKEKKKMQALVKGEKSDPGAVWITDGLTRRQANSPPQMIAFATAGLVSNPVKPDGSIEVYKWDAPIFDAIPVQK